MVMTRRKAAEPAQQSHAAPAASTEQEVDEAPVTVKKASRRKVTARTPSAAKTAAPTVTTTKATAVTTTTTSTSVAATTKMAAARRTRSKQTDSPLKSLEDIQQQASASSAKDPAVKATPLKTKRKYGASHYDKIGRSATPEQSATPAQDESNDDEGIFFTQSMQQVSSFPLLNTLIACLKVTSASRSLSFTLPPLLFTPPMEQSTIPMLLVSRTIPLQFLSTLILLPFLSTSIPFPFLGTPSLFLLALLLISTIRLHF
jgi:hypothetical protein